MDDSTEVLSLDELMDLAADRRSAQTRTERIPVSASPLLAAATAPAPVRRPPPAPKPARPARTHDTARQVRADARRAYEATLAHSRDWLGRGDNALMAATGLVALLLLVVVGAV